MAIKTVDRVLEEKGLHISQLAQLAGLPEERVAAIVAGRWLPNPKERERIATALELPADQIDWGHTMSPRNVRYHRFGLSEDL